MAQDYSTVFIPGERLVRSNELLTFALSQAGASIDTAYYLFRDTVTLYNCGRLAESRLHNPALARTYYRRHLALAHPKTPEERRAAKPTNLRSQTGTSKNKGGHKAALFHPLRLFDQTELWSAG